MNVRAPQRSTEGRIGGSAQATKTRLLVVPVPLSWSGDICLDRGGLNTELSANLSGQSALCRFCFPRYSLKRGVG